MRRNVFDNILRHDVFGNCFRSGLQIDFFTLRLYRRRFFNWYVAIDRRVSNRSCVVNRAYRSLYFRNRLRLLGGLGIFFVRRSLFNRDRVDLGCLCRRHGFRKLELFLSLNIVLDRGKGVDDRSLVVGHHRNDAGINQGLRGNRVIGRHIDSEQNVEGRGVRKLADGSRKVALGGRDRAFGKPAGIGGCRRRKRRDRRFRYVETFKTLGGSGNLACRVNDSDMGVCFLEALDHPLRTLGDRCKLPLGCCRKENGPLAMDFDKFTGPAKHDPLETGNNADCEASCIADLGKLAGGCLDLTKGHVGAVRPLIDQVVDRAKSEERCTASVRPQRHAHVGGKQHDSVARCKAFPDALVDGDVDERVLYRGHERPVG